MIKLKRQVMWLFLHFALYVYMHDLDFSSQRSMWKCFDRKEVLTVC